jgi:hypothetical protein
MYLMILKFKMSSETTKRGRGEIEGFLDEDYFLDKSGLTLRMLMSSSRS